jgi:uncharacterized protein YecE (DUF72 family)
MPPTAFLTSGIGYVRLHGRNPHNSLGGYDRPRDQRDQKVARMRQHDYLYSEVELAEWVKRIEHVGRYAESTFVVFNNDAEAKSVVNALQLRAMVAGDRPTAPAPKELRRRYPMQLGQYGPQQAEQQPLFPAGVSREQEAA